MDSLVKSFELLTTTPLIPAAIAGLVWGIIGGAMPGLSASVTMALILPLTYTLDPVMAIVVLACTYIGAEYGGSIPAILIRTPGTNSAAATVVDGYAMKLQGRAGEALGISLWSGVVGSLFGLAMLVLLTEPLSRVALLFKPTSYCALGILGLSIIASVSGGSLLKGLIAAVVGVMIATVGTDPLSGVGRQLQPVEHGLGCAVAAHGVDRQREAAQAALGGCRHVHAAPRRFGIRCEPRPSRRPRRPLRGRHSGRRSRRRGAGA